MSLRYRIALTVFVLEVIMVTAALSLTLRQSTEATTDLLRKADERLLSIVESPAKIALLTEELVAFQRFIDKAVTDSHVTGIMLLDSEGTYLIGTDSRFRDLPDDKVPVRPGEYWLWKSIDGAAGHLGKVGIRFSNAQLESQIGKARNTGYIVAFVGMLVIALAGIGIGFLLTRRLGELSEAAEKFAAGDTKVRVSHGGRDEVARLGRTFNAMAERISKSVEKLKESEQRNRRLVEGGPVSTFVIDTETFTIVDANQRLADLLGYSQDTLIGMTPIELSPPLQKGDVPSANLARELVERTLSGDNPRADWLVRDSRGKDIPCELQMSVYPDTTGHRVIGVIYDVSDRERIRQALEQRMRFEDIIVASSARLAGQKSEDIDEGIQALLSDIGQFAGVDRSYIFEFSKDLSRESCTHEWCSPGIEPEIDRLQDLPTHDFPWFLSRIGRGKVLHVPRVSDLPLEAAAEKAEFEAEGIRSLIMVPLMYKGEVSGYMGFDAVRQEVEWSPEVVIMLKIAGETVFNALHRKRTELDIQDKSRALERTNAALARSNEELQQFAYVASHDLREPMRAISGFSELLVQKYGDRLDKDAKEFISYIVDAVARMDGMIRDLLTYARVDSQAETPSPCDINGVMAVVKQNLLASIEESGAKITHDPLPTVETDCTQLTQLLQNLIANAIKFCDAEHAEIHVSAKQESGEWVFSVRDNGIGIDPAQAKSIFNIFKRLHTGERYAGTGIGLAVCKRIVERRGGRIWVENNADRGCTFYFTLCGAS